MPILQSSTWSIFAVVAAAAGCSPSAEAVRRPAVPPSNPATAKASTVPKKPGVRPLHVVSLEMTEDVLCAIRVDGRVACQEGNVFVLVPNIEKARKVVSTHPLCAIVDDGSTSCADGTKRPGPSAPPAPRRKTKLCPAPSLLDDTVCLRADGSPLGKVVESAKDCVLTDTGEVLCWGNNLEGGLADGTHMPRLTPTPVSGLGPTRHLVEWESATCAVLVEGAVRCWGPLPFEVDPKLALYRVVEGTQGSAHVSRPVPVPGAPQGLREFYDPECTLSLEGSAHCRTLATDRAAKLVLLDDHWPCAILTDATAVCAVGDEPHARKNPAPRLTGTLYERITDGENGQ
jgi:hypothetical protein